jgi:hypothetical protein
MVILAFGRERALRSAQGVAARTGKASNAPEERKTGSLSIS